MRKEVTYIADDGTRFTSYEECIKYEKSQQEERKRSIYDAISELDEIIWHQFYQDADGDYKAPELYASDEWLKSDIVYVLSDEDNDFEAAECKIRKIIQDSPYANDVLGIINFDELLEETKIRRDFKTAFKKIKYGYELSCVLRWSFYKRDIRNLAKLHKSNKYRRKIEELLTDCNFYTECGNFASKNYEKYLG